MANRVVTEPIKRILNSHNVKVAQKPFQRTDAIYSIPCNDCDNEYIGQTKRQFGARLKEHQKASSVTFIKSANQCSIKLCLIVHLVAV